MFLAVVVIGFGLYELRLLHALAVAAQSEGAFAGTSGAALAAQVAADRTFTSVFVAVVAVFILGVLLNILLVFISSLRLLLNGMERFKQGDYGYRIPLVSKSEFGQIATYMNEAIDHVESAQQKQKEAERKLRRLNATLEDRVEKRTAELKKTEERFRHLVENLSDIITILDRNGKITYQSPSLKSVLGYRPEEMIGQFIFDYVHPDDVEMTLATFRERLKKKGFGPQIELRFRHKDGSWRYLGAMSDNLLSDPAIQGFVVTSRDISGRKQAEARVRELDALKTTFIRTVSHQLRTPLNAVRWNLETLLAGDLGVLKPEQKEFVRITYQADVDVIRRINDLLTAMDIEEGRVRMNKEKASLEGLIRSVMLEMKKAAAKEITVAFVPPKSPLAPLDMDAEQIRAVLEKLLDNAVIYTKEKGKITITLKKTAGKVRVEVKDTGIGIPIAEQGNIFQRFFRATNAPQMEPDSSGLGLSIAKYYVEAHGGKIGFMSDEGKGTTFWFELPT